MQITNLYLILLIRRGPFVIYFDFNPCTSPCNNHTLYPSCRSCAISGIYADNKKMMWCNRYQVNELDDPICREYVLPNNNMMMAVSLAQAQHSFSRVYDRRFHFFETDTRPLMFSITKERERGCFIQRFSKSLHLAIRRICFYQFIVAPYRRTRFTSSPWV